MSKMRMQAVVAGVEARVVKQGQPDQRTIYDVIDGDGVKWTAWDLDLAKRAHALKDQTAVWEVEQKQNGQYTNRTILNIEGKGDPGMLTAIAEPPSGAVTFGDTTSNANATAFDPPGTTATPERTSIHRQCAAKVVGNMAAAQGMTPDEFWLNIDSLVTYFETGRTPMSDVASVVATQTDTFPAADDDIPF